MSIISLPWVDIPHTFFRKPIFALCSLLKTSLLLITVIQHTRAQAKVGSLQLELLSVYKCYEILCHFGNYLLLVVILILVLFVLSLVGKVLKQESCFVCLLICSLGQAFEPRRAED